MRSVFDDFELEFVEITAKEITATSLCPTHELITCEYDDDPCDD